MGKWINRAVLVIRPRKPYLDWAAGIDEEAPEHAKTLENKVSIYLVGEDPKGKQETAPLDGYFKKIFEEELAAWSIDKGDWPKGRTLELFLQWFDVARESVATDLEKGPIKHEKV